MTETTRRDVLKGFAVAAGWVVLRPPKPKPTKTPTPTPTVAPSPASMWLSAQPGAAAPGAAWVGGAF